LLLFHKPWQKKTFLSLSPHRPNPNPKSNRYNSLQSIQSRPKFPEHLQQCLVCDPAKIFFTSKFSYFTFLQPPPMKLKLEQQIDRDLLTANHLDQSV
jgi:hypothetical protein